MIASALAWHGGETGAPEGYTITCVLRLHTYLCREPTICSHSGAHRRDFIVIESAKV